MKENANQNNLKVSQYTFQEKKYNDKVKYCPECRERMTFELFSAHGTNWIFLKRALTISKTIYGSICTFGPENSNLGNVIQGNNFKRTLYKNVHSSTIIMVKKIKTIQVAVKEAKEKKQSRWRTDTAYQKKKILYSH